MRAWLAGALVGLVGCGGPIKEVAFEEGVSPGTGTVTFTSKAEGDAWVRWRQAGEEGWTLTPTSPAADGRIVVLGLPTGRTIEYEVVLDKGGREVASKAQEAEVSVPARNVLKFGQNVWEPSRSCMDGGYVLLSYIGDGFSGYGVIDREGDWVNSMDWPSDEQLSRVRPGRDGQSIVFAVADPGKREDIAKIYRVDLLGNLLSKTRTLQGHHDFFEVSEGRFAWLGFEMRDVPAPPNGENVGGEICLAVDTLFEADEGAEEADYDEIWNAWDAADYPPGPYVLPGDAVNSNGQPSFLKNGCYELGHGNSLAYLASEDAYYMNWRWLDVVFKVTGDGETVWQWGGDHSDFALEPATAFDGGHFSEVWPGGMLYFDNRAAKDEDNDDLGSRLVEYRFDDDGYEQVWEHEEPTRAYENLLGDVQRMPIEGCDNVLVSWSGQGKVQEITREGEVVWEVASQTVGGITSRLFFVPDLYDLSGMGYTD